MRHFLIIFILSYNVSVQAQKEHLWGEIQKIIRNEEDVDLTKASGATIAIIDGDSVYSYAIGTVAHNSDKEVSEHTIFPAGGITHAHLILLTYHIMQLGLISKDDALSKFSLSEFKDTWIDKLTIAQLLSHTSGLPKILPGMSKYKTDADDEYKYFNSDSTDIELKRWAKTNPAKSEVIHSQYNFYLLSKILWMVRDVRVHQHGLMIPEMTGTYFEKPERLHEDTIVNFYSREGRQVPEQHLGALTNTMGMKTNANDLSILMKIYLRLSNKDDFKSLFLVKQPKPRKNREELYSSGGFRYFETKKSGDLYFMTGNMKGSSAFFCFAPKTSTGVIILSNSGKSVHTLGMHIMRMINYQYSRTY